MRIQSSVSMGFSFQLPEGCYLSTALKQGHLNLSCTGNTPEEATRKFAESKRAIITALSVPSDEQS